jgi:hypothetical protein
MRIWAVLNCFVNGISFAESMNMKNFSDRMWLVILGVAVAILVTLTTIVWSEPAGERTGSGRIGVKPVPQAVAPKIGLVTLHSALKSLSSFIKR